MMLVTCSEAFWRTRFQTLITSPHVVSTIWHARLFIDSTVEISAPQAGLITTSVDSVTESELFGQSNNRSTLLEDPSLAANAFHEAAFVVAFDLRLHARHHIGRAEIDSRGFDGGGDLSAQGCSL